jgi:hypothetical protein
MFVAAASFGDGVAAVVLRSVAAAASERAAGAHRLWRHAEPAAFLA